MPDTPKLQSGGAQNNVSPNEQPGVHLYTKAKKSAVNSTNMRKKIESSIHNMSFDQTPPPSGVNHIAPKTQYDLKPVGPRLSYSYSEQNLSHNGNDVNFPYGDRFLQPYAFSNGHSRNASSYCKKDMSEDERSSSSDEWFTPPSEPSSSMLNLSTRPRLDDSATSRFTLESNHGSVVDTYEHSEHSIEFGRQAAGHSAASYPSQSHGIYTATSPFYQSYLPLYRQQSRLFQNRTTVETGMPNGYTMPGSMMDDSEMTARPLFEPNGLHNTTSLLPNTDHRRDIEPHTNRHRGELTGPDKYEYDLRRAQLKASSRTSALLAGFAMVALVELQYDADTPFYLLVVLAIVTTFLVSVHLIALMTSTCILPHIEASGCTEDSPHKKLEFFIDMSWTFSTCIGLLLFLLEIVVIFFVKFSAVKSIGGAWIMLLFMVPVFIAFGVISYQIHHRRQQHSVNRVGTKVGDLENIIEAHEHPPYDFQKPIVGNMTVQQV